MSCDASCFGDDGQMDCLQGKPCPSSVPILPPTGYHLYLVGLYVPPVEEDA